MGLKARKTENNCCVFFTGKYIYIKSSPPSMKGNVAQLRSPMLPPAGEKGYCFRFWYHMFGTTVGSLRMLLLSVDPFEKTVVKHRLNEHLSPLGYVRSGLSVGSDPFTSLYYRVRKAAVGLIEKYLWLFPLGFLSVIILFTWLWNADCKITLMYGSECKPWCCKNLLTSSLRSESAYFLSCRCGKNQEIRGMNGCRYRVMWRCRKFTKWFWRLLWEEKLET